MATQGFIWKEITWLPWLLESKNNDKVVSFFGAIFYVYTNVDNRERAKASYWKFVGRKTWKFKAAMRKWEMLAASKAKMSGSENKSEHEHRKQNIA